MKTINPHLEVERFTLPPRTGRVGFLDIIALLLRPVKRLLGALNTVALVVTTECGRFGLAVGNVGVSVDNVAIKGV
jgi:hypothetical protein